MFQSRIFWKLLSAFAALHLLAALLLVRLTLSGLAENSYRDASLRLDATLQQAVEVCGAEMANPTPQLAARLAKLTQETGVQVTLLDAQGALKQGGLRDAEAADEKDFEGGDGEAINFSELPEVLAALETGVGVHQYRSADMPTLAKARWIRQQEKTIGVIRAAMPVSGANQHFAVFGGRYFYFAVAVGLALLAVTYALVRHLVTPVLAIGRGADAIASGDYQQRIFVSNNDELGALAKSFNRMSQEFGTQLGELREATQRQATVLGGMVEGVIAIDERQRVLFANSAAGKLFDFVPPQVEGRPLLEVVRHHALSEAVAIGLSSGRPQRLEIEWEGGERLTLSTQVTPLPGDPCPGVVVVLHDTTELRRLESLRSDFVANVSHELRTPLSTIKAYAETLLNGALNDELHSIQFVHRIEEQADRLDALIQDMLSLARIESAQQPFDIARINVADVADACIEDYQRQASAKRITLGLTPASPAVSVKVDPEGLRVILNNLLDNAIKYTPAEGSVSLRWSQATSVNGARSEPMVRIEVADTGVGIPEEALSRVFERFYRVDKARSREVGGTGLGLSIVKHLAQSFGGTVAVESEVDRGTTFWIELPAG